MLMTLSISSYPLNLYPRERARATHWQQRFNIHDLSINKALGSAS